MYNKNVQGTIFLCRTIDILHNNNNDDYDNSNESNCMITKLKKMMVRRLQETKDGGYTHVNSSRMKKEKKKCTVKRQRSLDMRQSCKLT